MAAKGVEIAILGGGAAGLALALGLIRSPLRDRNILIVEKEIKNKNDRTWCYWVREPSLFDSICCKTWETLRFTTEEQDLRIQLQPYRYQMVRGSDYYRYIHDELAKFPNVEIVRGSAEAVQDGEEAAFVEVNGETIQANWVFDSRFRQEDASRTSGKYLSLLQHFRGWEIESEQPVFDPAAASLFDLRVPQPEGLAFAYVLPLTEYRGLVEYTLFSKNLQKPEVYLQAVESYIGNKLGLKTYQIVEEEAGIIPMTSRPVQRRLGKRILAIGTRGGRVKPSTGYAFQRIQRDSQAIVSSMLRYGHPFHVSPASRRYLFYDSLLLDVLARSDPKIRSIFTAMFSRNPIDRVFRFMDERTSLLEDGLILASLPPVPFLYAFFRKALGFYR